jgi:hypothetical protein
MLEYEIIDNIEKALEDDNTKEDSIIVNSVYNNTTEHSKDEIIHQLREELLEKENQYKLEILRNSISTAILHKKYKRKIEDTENLLKIYKDLDIQNISKIGYLENTRLSLNNILEEKCVESVNMNKLLNIANMEITAIKTAYENLELATQNRINFYTKEMEKHSIEELLLMERIKKLEGTLRKNKRYTCASFF